MSPKIESGRQQERRKALERLEGRSTTAESQECLLDETDWTKNSKMGWHEAQNLYDLSSRRRLSEASLARVDERAELDTEAKFSLLRVQSSKASAITAKRLVLRRSPGATERVPLTWSEGARLPFSKDKIAHSSNTVLLRPVSEPPPQVFKWRGAIPGYQSLQPPFELIHSPNANRSSRSSHVIVSAPGGPKKTYQIGNVIGRGQCGTTVFRALDIGTGRIVAVKRIAIKSQSKTDTEVLAKEVEICKRISHPSCVTYLGAANTGRHFDIVLEYVENGSLLDMLKSFGGSFSESLAATYAVKILEGLAYLHHNLIIHCDLKAANVLTTKNGNIKLSDFGVSLSMSIDNEQIVQGTPNWMAPEIIELKGATTGSDIWSLGALIIELVTGHAPYHDLLPMTVLYRIVEDLMPPLPTGSSIELIEFWHSCFQRTPSMRPSARQLMSHQWLVSKWDPADDLSAQDSISFLRRISKEVATGTLVSSGATSPQVALSPSARLLSALAASPPAGHSFELDMEHSDQNTPPEIDKRWSGAAKPVLATIGMPTQRSTILRSKAATLPSHDLVEIKFRRAVHCHLCSKVIKRKGLLCDGCATICHAACSEFLPLVCGPSVFSGLPPLAMQRHSHRSTSSPDSAIPQRSKASDAIREQKPYQFGISPAGHYMPDRRNELPEPSPYTSQDSTETEEDSWSPQTPHGSPPAMPALHRGMTAIEQTSPSYLSKEKSECKIA